MNDTITTSPLSVISFATSAQAVAHVVAVEHARVHAFGVQPALEQVRDRRLAGAGDAGHPQHARLMRVELRVRGLGHLEALPAHVGGAAHGARDHPRGDRAARRAVDQDAAAQVVVGDVGVERDRPVERQRDVADLVAVQRARLALLAGVDVDGERELGDPRRRAAGA
jgi:hypothetical protein